MGNYIYTYNDNNDTYKSLINNLHKYLFETELKLSYNTELINQLLDEKQQLNILLIHHQQRYNELNEKCKKYKKQLDEKNINNKM